jgi:hypothetical protein
MIKSKGVQVICALGGYKKLNSITIPIYDDYYLILIFVVHAKFLTN